VRRHQQSAHHRRVRPACAARGAAHL
jgi:hypothetical protein